MQKVVSVEVMRNSDEALIASGFDSKELMRLAGVAVYEKCNWVGKIAIVTGSGNNAGDGYVIALCLLRSGFIPTLVRTSDRFSKDGKYYYEQCIAEGVVDTVFDSDKGLSEFGTIVDCLLGTGFKGVPEGTVADAIRAINDSSAEVISVDINSGLNGDNGFGDLVVHSILTVCVGSLKKGLLLNEAKDYAHKVVTVDIGIPIVGEYDYLIEDEDVKESFFPIRKRYSHKNKYGTVGVLGGCIEYSGAVKLANMSCTALRSGVGLSRLIVPSSIINSVSPYLLESTLFPLPSNETGGVVFDEKSISSAVTGVNALAVGMGWGSSSENELILKYLLDNLEIPLIIDADGLNALTRMGFDVLKEAKCKVILTPHLGEFSRMTGLSVNELSKDLCAHARAFAATHKVVLLLKGSTTIVTDGKELYYSESGSVGMATAGSGDVLSGVILGLCAVECDRLTYRVAAAAHITGRAGEFAAKRVGEYSMLARDTVDNIGSAITAIIRS